LLPYRFLLGFLFPIQLFPGEGAKLIAQEPNLFLHAPWRVHHFGRIEDRITAYESGKRGLVHRLRRAVGFQARPVGIIPRREGFPDARGAVTDPNIAVASARIAELGEASVFLRREDL
jgi:hypothetical protein